MCLHSPMKVAARTSLACFQQIEQLRHLRVQRVEHFLGRVHVTKLVRLLVRLDLILIRPEVLQHELHIQMREPLPCFIERTQQMVHAMLRNSLASEAVQFADRAEWLADSELVPYEEAAIRRPLSYQRWRRAPV